MSFPKPVSGWKCRASSVSSGASERTSPEGPSPGPWDSWADCLPSVGAGLAKCPAQGLLSAPLPLAQKKPGPLAQSSPYLEGTEPSGRLYA